MALDLSRNKRYQLAKAATFLTDKYIGFINYALAVALAVVGIGLLYWGFSGGWLALSFCSWPLAWQVWVSRALVRIPPSPKDSSISGLLSSNILGHLPANPAPTDIASALNYSRGGLFFAIRYGISPSMLNMIVSREPEDTEALWQKAVALQQKYGGATIGGSALTAALINTSPNADKFLAGLELDKDAIESGSAWFNNVSRIVEDHFAPRKTGGFARDWAFGFTPLLERFGNNLSEQLAGRSGLIVKLDTFDEISRQLNQYLSSAARHNAALIGKLGSGKMAFIQHYAAQLMGDSETPKSLLHNQIVSLDAASLISAAPSRGQLEGLINEVFAEAHRAKNIILCLDNAQLFFEDGVGSVNLSSLLLPILEAGGLRIILAMDDNRWLKISQELPAVASALNKINIKPSSKSQTIQILQAQLIGLEYRSKVTFNYQALITAYDLGLRYVPELAMPGKAIRILESSVNFAENGLVSKRSVISAVEQMTGVKVGSMDSSQEKDVLLNLEELIHQRMINQSQAVKAVSDALRRARSGVRNQNRPIGTFLFLGPTGVGKTELSKILSEIYFGGSGHLVRIDLNEYVRSEDVARLIADPVSNQYSLAAQVSKQPFSVVLLDEIEKAHQDVLSTLLQVLDEGILRDINGREISCRDTIIIASSNAGAQQIYDKSTVEGGLAELESQIVDNLINEGIFRPEFINRFDEVVMFKPLGKAELMEVIGLIINDLNDNLAKQKIAVQLDQASREILVDAGYDPRLGARPMRRIVQKTVENIVAKLMISGQISPGSTVEITADMIRDNLAS